MTIKPVEQAEDMIPMKVRKERHKMLSIIATLDGKLLQDVTDEALTEYIDRRGIVISVSSESDDIAA